MNFIKLKKITVDMKRWIRNPPRNKHYNLINMTLQAHKILQTKNHNRKRKIMKNFYELKPRDAKYLSLFASFP